jgi:hypothetical protein
MARLSTPSFGRQGEDRMLTARAQGNWPVPQMVQALLVYSSSGEGQRIRHIGIPFYASVTKLAFGT